jgi:hypothetical protein
MFFVIVPGTRRALTKEFKKNQDGLREGSEECRGACLRGVKGLVAHWLRQNARHKAWSFVASVASIGEADHGVLLPFRRVQS